MVKSAWAVVEPCRGSRRCAIPDPSGQTAPLCRWHREDARPDATHPGRGRPGIAWAVLGRPAARRLQPDPPWSQPETVGVTAAADELDHRLLPAQPTRTSSRAF